MDALSLGKNRGLVDEPINVESNFHVFPHTCSYGEVALWYHKSHQLENQRSSTITCENPIVTGSVSG